MARSGRFGTSLQPFGSRAGSDFSGYAIGSMPEAPRPVAQAAPEPEQVAPPASSGPAVTPPPTTSAVPVRQVAPPRPRTAPPRGAVPRPVIPVVRRTPNPVRGRPGATKRAPVNSRGAALNARTGGGARMYETNPKKALPKATPRPAAKTPARPISVPRAR